MLYWSQCISNFVHFYLFRTVYVCESENANVLSTSAIINGECLVYIQFGLKYKVYEIGKLPINES